MNDFDAPPIWFRLPPGFHDIGVGDRCAAEAIVSALGDPLAQSQIAQLMDGLDELSQHRVVHTSIGLHPDDGLGVCTSLFSLTVLLADHPNPRVSVARTALEIAQSALWSSSTRRLIEVSSTLPCPLVAGTLCLPEVDQRVFQARVVMAHPGGPYVFVLDLTSAAIDHTGAYTDIIEAVTHTVRFSDPDAAPPGPPRTSRILDVLL